MMKTWECDCGRINPHTEIKCLSCVALRSVEKPPLPPMNLDSAEKSESTEDKARKILFKHVGVGAYGDYISCSTKPIIDAIVEVLIKNQKKMKTKDEILIEQAVVAFENEEKRKPTQEEMETLKNPPLEIRNMMFKCMDEFAAQEKLQAERGSLEEMANAWLEATQKNIDSDSDKINAAQKLCDKLNFEVFRHRYPQITFENSVNRITVSIR